MNGPAEQPPHGYATGGPVEPGSVMPDLDHPACSWIVDPGTQALMESFLVDPARTGTTINETSGQIADSFIRDLVESTRVEPAPPPSWMNTPITWDDLVDLHDRYAPPPMPTAIVVDERTWNALRRAVPAVDARPSLGPSPYGFGVPVVVRSEPHRAQRVRRTGTLVGRRARHAGALRVARLQRRVDRRAARRARQAAPAVYGMFW